MKQQCSSNEAAMKQQCSSNAAAMQQQCSSNAAAMHHAAMIHPGCFDSTLEGSQWKSIDLKRQIQ